MAPLGDRNANRQSRIPTVGSDGTARVRVNNENAPPGTNLSRLLAPTKSSVARAKSPSPIPLPIISRVNNDRPVRGRLSAVASSDSLKASSVRRQSLRRPSPTPDMQHSVSRISEAPPVSLRIPVRPSRPSTPCNDLIEMRTSMSPIKSAPQIRAPRLDKAHPTPLSHLPSPSKFSRSIIDATEGPLIRSPGTPHEVEWPSLSPQRPVSRCGSMTPSKTPKMKSSKLPRSSIHNSPALVSPILDQEYTRPISPDVTPDFDTTIALDCSDDMQTGLTVADARSNEDHPPRSSSLRTNVDLGLGISTSEDSSNESSNESLEHRYLPATNSFSRPRAQYSAKSPALSAPASSILPHSKPTVPVSRLPTSSPKKTSSVTEIRPQRPHPKDSPVVEGTLTFAGRPLNNPKDLATLDQGGLQSSRNRANTIKSSSTRKSNLTLSDLTPRVPSPAEPNKISPIRFLFSDKGDDTNEAVEYSRVKQLSGNLLSSTFAGSTLSISNDADQLILGPSKARAAPRAFNSTLQSPTEADFDLPSPSSNGFHVSWPDNFGFTVDDVGQTSPTVQSSPSVRKESMGFPPPISRITEPSEPPGQDAIADIQSSFEATPFEKNAPLASLSAMSDHPESVTSSAFEDTVQDGVAEQHITATLCILEGTPIKQSATRQQQDSGSSKNVKEIERQFKEPQKEIKQGNPLAQDTCTPSAQKPVKKRLSMAKLPKVAPKDETPVRPRNERLPSYMLPTPASEARKNVTASNSDARRSNAAQGVMSSSDNRQNPQPARLTPEPTSASGRAAPSGRHTPVSGLRSGAHNGRFTPNDLRPSPSGRDTPSTDLQGTASTIRANVSRKSSHEMPNKTTIGVSDSRPAQVDTPANCEANAPATISHSVPVNEAARNGSATPITRPRSESKGKSVLNNLKGLFSSGKRENPSTPGRRFSIGSRKSMTMEPDVPDVPALPPMLDTKRKSTTKSILVKRDADEEARPSSSETSNESAGIMPGPRRKSTVNHPTSKIDTEYTQDKKPHLRRKSSKMRIPPTVPSTGTESEQEKRDTVALMEMGLTLRQEAFKEDDLVRKERMTSFAQVMLDTVTNAVEAERNMYAAMQAAEQAKMSYMMTQQSVQEMNKLVSTSRRLPLFKKKKQQPNAGA